jgi:hypothetical protein
MAARGLALARTSGAFTRRVQAARIEGNPQRLAATPE